MTKVQLTDIPGVGEGKAFHLRKAGFVSVESVASAARDDLMAVPHIGRATADSLQRQARLLLEATAAVTSAESDPGTDAGADGQPQRGSVEVPATAAKKGRKGKGRKKEKDCKEKAGKKAEKKRKEKKKKKDKKNRKKDRSRGSASSEPKKKGKRKKGGVGKGKRKKAKKK